MRRLPRLLPPSTASYAPSYAFVVVDIDVSCFARAQGARRGGRMASRRRPTPIFSLDGGNSVGGCRCRCRRHRRCCRRPPLLLRNGRSQRTRSFVRCLPPSSHRQAHLRNPGILWTRPGRGRRALASSRVRTTMTTTRCRARLRLPDAPGEGGSARTPVWGGRPGCQGSDRSIAVVVAIVVVDVVVSSLVRIAARQ